MMTNTLHNFPRDVFLGFDTLLDRLDRIDNASKQTYPPYNVIKKDDNHYLIEIAIAGFNREDIDLTLEKGVLTVEGEKTAEDTNKYVHKGISARNFRRVFTLADTIKVVGADVINGMLYIGLENVVPEEDQPQKINLGQFAKSAKKLLLG